MNWAKKLVLAAGLTVLGGATAFGAANWIGNAAICVNGSDWYYNDNALGWCTKGAFDGATLGTIGTESFTIGGQIQLYDEAGANWGQGTAYMYYSIDGATAVRTSLTYYDFKDSNNFFQSGGATFAPVTISLSGLSSGTSHTLAVYFKDIDGRKTTTTVTATFSVGTIQQEPGNVWHQLATPEPWASAMMRDPLVPEAGAEPYLRLGCYPGTGNSAMTAASVFYRVNSGSWTELALGPSDVSTSQHPENAYWTNALPAVSQGDAVSYYFKAEFANAATLGTTYVGSSTNANGYVQTLDEAEAQAGPFTFTVAAHVANLGNCWHIPGQFEPKANQTMRDPLYPSAGQKVTFYVGNQYGGDGNTGDVTGWNLHYRTNSEAAWTTVAMGWDDSSQTAWNKYGKAELAGGLPTGTTEYYFELNYSDHDTTWLGSSATGTRGQTFATEAEAQAEPFTCAVSGQAGQEPGFMWHAGNAVLAGTNAVQFWVKIGYTKDGVDWADTVELRYKFESGSVPATAVKTGRTARRHSAKALTGYQTLAFTRDHEEEDTSSNGNSVWWCCTLTSDDFLDGSKYLAYEIAAKNSAGNNEWRKADYHTSSATELFYYTMFKPGTGRLTVNGMNADYTTSKFFIDEKETGGDTVTLDVVYEPPTNGLSQVQVFHNVGRRDFWNADIDDNHIPDAIFPPDGDLIVPGMESDGDLSNDPYFVAVPMTCDTGANVWRATITAERCGAYRLTARYKDPQTGKWVYCSAKGMRDHAVVISPKKVLQQSIYELNGLTAAATAANKDGRSTFNTLIYGPSGTNRNELDEFSIQYLNRIQANCLWFQPIHPATQYDNETAGPGSPYAARDYFAVSKWFGSQTTTASAMSEFAQFVAACDAGKSPTMDHSDVGTINIMLDGVFNHTSWDAVLGARGVELLAARGVTKYYDQYGVEHDVTADTPIGNVRPGWYANYSNYGAPATHFWDASWHNVATAPDRGDFGKWGDTAELFYGRYAALVEHNDEDNGNYLNEDDWFDWSCMTNAGYYTEELWEYLGSYVEYWLDKTGNDGVNHWDETDDLGIDGLRCDFGQGLPPQFWEYCINRARSHKWNFMFMAESLDGGKVGYRSNRHFDILNESFVFAAKDAGSPGDMLAVLDGKKNAYNGGAILLNLTSHDEVMPYMDPWKTASRYALLASVKGLPMTFYGQEQGIIPVDTGEHPTQGLPEGYALQPNDRRTGFHEFELNFGKWVAHFKNWNKVTVWNDPPSKSWAGDDGTESRGMAQLYGRINWARRSSPALQSDIQWMLPDFGHDYYSGDAWMMAKADSYGALANGGDAVLAFVFFIKDGDGSHSGRWAHAGIPAGAAEMLGLEAGESYTARNLAAANSSAILWTKTTEELTSDGVAVEFFGDSNGHKLYDDGAMVYFLKLEKAVPPATHTITVTIGANGSVSPSGTVSVVEGEDQEFVITADSGYRIESVLADGVAVATFGDSDTTYTYTWENVTADGTLAASFVEQTVVPVDPVASNGVVVSAAWLDGIYGAGNWTADIVDMVGGNGRPVWQSYVAGLDPTDESSVFEIDSADVEMPASGNLELSLTIPPDRVGSLEYADQLVNGNWTVTHSCTNTGSEPLTVRWTNAPAATGNFYRLRLSLNE